MDYFLVKYFATNLDVIILQVLDTNHPMTCYNDVYHLAIKGFPSHFQELPQNRFCDYTKINK